MVQMKANLADLETQLKVARVPDLAQVEQLRNQLKIEKDTSDSLRTRLKNSDVEKAGNVGAVGIGQFRSRSASTATFCNEVQS